MYNFIQLLIESAITFSIFYIIYRIFLDKLTFHKLNRLVLLLILPVSIILPVANKLLPKLQPEVIEIPLFEEVTFKSISQQLNLIEQPIIETSFNFLTLLTVIYWFVFSLFLLRIVINTRNLIVLKNKSSKVKINGYQVVKADVSEVFSYLNWIFIPIENTKQLNLKILEHENAHIQYKHSWDVIISEIYIAFLWFNPLVYFYQKSLKSVHEFQADEGVLKKGFNTSQYLQLLLESIDVQKPNTFYNYFNHPLLKKRVTMMTKAKSSKFLKLNYTVLIPLIFLLIFAFKAPILDKSKYTNISDVITLKSDPPSLYPVQNSSKEDITSFFEDYRNFPKNDEKKQKHGGIDLRAKIGTPVIATADGIVIKASMEGKWGNLIIIKHEDGYETWYAHLQGFKCKENLMVKKGDVIGFVGNTGKSSGPHLHYEVKLNGDRLNPIDFLK